MELAAQLKQEKVAEELTNAAVENGLRLTADVFEHLLKLKAESKMECLEKLLIFASDNMFEGKPKGDTFLFELFSDNAFLRGR